MSTERTQGRRGKWTVRPFSRNPEGNSSRKEKSCAQKEKSPADHRGRRGLETMESQTFLSQKQVPSKAADRLNFAAGIFAWGRESPLKGKNFRMHDVAGAKRRQRSARRKIRAGGLEIFSMGCAAPLTAAMWEGCRFCQNLSIQTNQNNDRIRKVLSGETNAI